MSSWLPRMCPLRVRIDNLCRQISDFIRGQYKSGTGKDFPVKDKPT